MSSPLREALDRTLLLMRDDLVADVQDASLMAALTDTQVVLVADARNLSCHAAQCAFITAAILMARSGHCVHLAAPDARLAGPQPPLKGDHLLGALLDIGNDLLPGVGFSLQAPSGSVDLQICFGDSPERFRATRTLKVNATAWSAQMGAASSMGRWAEEHWPMGAFGAGALAAVEVFKASMQRLRGFAKDPTHFDLLFAATHRIHLELAPSNTPQAVGLGAMDFVSGGAITNATLFVLARLLGARGGGRIIEPEMPDLSNLNRYMLLRRSEIPLKKAVLLRELTHPRLKFEAIVDRFQGGSKQQLGELAPNVLVGVDDIPTRWEVQAQQPQWLGIGATTHWAAMASFHRRGLACARCLHPRDELAAGPIPTVAFVSFFSGLMAACYFTRRQAGEQTSLAEQYTYLVPLRPETIWRSSVASRIDCLSCGPASSYQAQGH